MIRSVVRYLAVLTLAATALTASIPAQQGVQMNPGLFAELRWRNIGPHRASRTRAAAGHRSQPYTFYMAAVNGGVWKTTDAGRTWKPIFDDQPTGSIGAIAVAPSDSEHHLRRERRGAAAAGPLDRRRRLQVDRRRQDLDAPRPARRAADSQDRRRSDATPTGCSSPRSAIRTVPTRSAASSARPTADDVRARALQGREHRRQRRRHRSVEPRTSSTPRCGRSVRGRGRTRCGPGSGGGIFKSTDGGTTWKPLTNGLPVVVQANVAISPANPKRLYAAVAGYDKAGTGSDRGAAGIYRCDDAGETWTRITTDTRPAGRIGGGDLPMPIAHPKDPDIVIMASTVSWKSTDGGKTWASFKGAPGGDDYQNGWINPDNPDIILLAADQGAVVTLNGGETWSSWYNQPTGAVLPRGGRQRVSVSRLQRAAGERIGLRLEPRQLRRDHVSRLAAGRRRRIRLRRARSAQSRHRLRRRR